MHNAHTTHTQSTYNAPEARKVDPEARKAAPAHHPDADFLALHFASSSFNGQFITGKRIAGIPALQTLGTYKAGSAAAALKGLRLYDGADFYITANQMTGNQHSDGAVFAFQNIVVDVDCHAESWSERSIEAAVSQLVAALRRQIGSSDKLAPNTITRTGRGLQLWWTIQPMYAGRGSSSSPAFLYYRLRDRIIQEVNETIASLPLPSSIFGKIDAGASSNDSGFFRLPGSYNTKSRSWSSCEILHENRINVSETIGRIQRSGAGLRKDGKLYPRTVAQITSSKAWNVRESCRILTVLGTLRDMRRRAGTESRGNEHRNNYLYCLYSAARPSLDEKLVRGLVETFNEGFLQPMRSAELAATLSWPKKHNKRGLKNAKIIELLEITPEEQDKLHFYAAGSGKNNSREAERQSARERKKLRDEQIVELRSKGHTLEEIAQSCGCTRQTVAAVIERDAKILSKAERETRILWMLSAGYTPTEIADLVGCSLKTVYNVKNKAPAADQSERAGESMPADAHEQNGSEAPAAAQAVRAWEAMPAEGHRTPQEREKLEGDRMDAQGEQARTAAARAHTIDVQMNQAHRQQPAGLPGVLSFCKMLKNRHYMMLSAVGGQAFSRISGQEEDDQEEWPNTS